MKVLVLMLVLAVGGFSQQLVGTAKGNAYYVYLPIKDGDNISFIGLLSPYLIINNKIIPDQDNFSLTVFTANCRTYEYTPLSWFSQKDGKSGSGDYKPVVSYKAVKPEVIFKAIERVCN